MNRFAYRSTGFAIKAVSELLKARIKVYGQENIPVGSVIYVINHFTRIETLFLPYHINKLTDIPVWSLAAAELFKGGLGNFLNKVGAVSTDNPDRDLLMVKTLLTGEASWVIFPEGLMVKSKKIYERGYKKGRFLIAAPEGKRLPHTGAATLALRTEFYRDRIRMMRKISPAEAERLINLFQIESVDTVLNKNTFIVPVNITYYPIRARQNIVSNLVTKFVEDVPDRVIEEMMTEGTMLFSGVDIDIRFGESIKVRQYMKSPVIQNDISTSSVINFDDPIASRAMMRKSALKIMERYMSAIYRMTSVNHDHIFATILRYIPVTTIEEIDLKRRVFLATHFNFKKANIQRHSSMSGSQINLLTDDRYGKYKNFLTAAIDAGVLTKKGNTLVKEPSFNPSLDFHRVRIDNPIAVITNEIEPLTEFQEHLSYLAYQPAVRIKHLVTRHLIDKSVFEFEKDYANYYIEGETKDKQVGMPFLLKGEARATGILLVHGYMAAPMEVRGLADYLHKKGYWVGVPRLKGHGTSPEDLATRSYMEWIEIVEEAYVALRHLCEKIFVGGFSTGAGLSLDLITRVQNVSGVFAVSPPMKLHDFSSKFVPAVDTWNRLMEKVRFKAAKVEFIKNNSEHPNINYMRNPVSGIRELERLMDSIEPKMTSISVPALIIQSFSDPVVNPIGSRKIFELIGSKDKEYLMVNYERHGILIGEGSERVFKAIGEFIERQLQKKTTG